jgi:hypothetical protein
VGARIPSICHGNVKFVIVTRWVILRETKGLLFACATAGETQVLPRHRQRHGSGEAGNYSRDGRPAGQVFRDFRAVLAQFAGCLCGSPVKEKLHKELRAIKPFAAAAAR